MSRVRIDTKKERSFTGTCQSFGEWWVVRRLFAEKAWGQSHLQGQIYYRTVVHGGQSLYPCNEA